MYCRAEYQVGIDHGCVQMKKLGVQLMFWRTDLSTDTANFNISSAKLMLKAL